MTSVDHRTVKPVHGLAAVVGFLVLVEFASGILQGYYTPIYPQIAEHLSIAEGDVNWFEAAQLIVSALCIPLLSRLVKPWPGIVDVEPMPDEAGDDAEETEGDES